MSEHTLDPKCRKRAHEALDEWLDEITQRPLSSEDGEGHVFKLDAYAVHVDAQGQCTFSFMLSRKASEIL